MSRVRDHWSIGEVLSLLQDEFPEVTISKIRFLESQGLIDPERTPSGYRKFSDTDYDRLYWILEQQRDHYLPLRVIRDRLDEGQDIGPAPRRSGLLIGDPVSERAGEAEGDEDGDGSPTPPRAPDGYEVASQPVDESFSEALADVAGPVSTNDGESHPVRDGEFNALAEAMAGDTPPEDVGGNVTVDADENASDRPYNVEDEPDYKDDVPADDLSADLSAAGSSTNEPTDDAAAAGEVPPEVPDGESASDLADPDVAETDPEATEPSDKTSETDDEQDGSDTVSQPKPAPRLLGTRSEAPRPTTKTTAEALAPSPRPSLPGSSVALTREELAEQSGSTPGMVTELEKHGMITPRMVGTTVLFDSTALTISRLAVQFGRYGLEPRHLRTFRLGAEREVTLLTQSIGPTLKANNPETRRRSFDTLQDLAELSASLRSIIVRDLVADLEPEG